MGHILYVFEPSRRDESNGAIFKWFGCDPTDLLRVKCEFRSKMPSIIEYTIHINTLLRHICCRMHYSSWLHTPTPPLCYPSLTFYYTTVHKSYETEYFAMYNQLVLSTGYYSGVLYHTVCALQTAVCGDTRKHYHLQHLLHTCTYTLS